MTRDEHRAHHVSLHQALDLLLADYLVQHRGALPSKMMLMQLIEWSFTQTTEPSFRCSRCERVSYNPNDAEQRYCGQCHAFLDDPSPNIPD
jgi:hypothetical protein